ncbi:Uncharacterised protein [Legionella steigerwaltii]|uniref:Transporter suffix domain-containing protein n=1 Tax=Legionella steigerwaltii TaxID=460 RepID=A0A378L6V8_9GAMM|nr:hypothetical protein [Legionella steigerwaltii]KTD76083.1 hypothetical protein Lstg_2371 [Legionella steigerwaltii]STY22100.1 Uncharacterised protein [Legionella steigerwaltii]
MQEETKTNSTISKTKLFFGFLILMISFLVPFSIPLIMQLNISSPMKAVISSVLLFGIPEIGMLIAVIILGTEGYSYLKSRILFWLKNSVSTVNSRVRFRIGITFFSVSLVLGFLLPYISYFFPTSIQKNLYFYILFLDLVFFISLFILGKNFWGKVKKLFIYEEEQ